jgi:hypothetical protein
MFTFAEIYDTMWLVAIFAVILWGCYVSHVRQICEETPQLDKPGAADEIPSRAEILAQVMKPTLDPTRNEYSTPSRTETRL